MLRSLLTWGVRGAVAGPAKSWVFTSAAMVLWGFVSKRAARTELIDLSRTRPGDRVLIEHLHITRKEQMKQMKKARKVDKVEMKAEKRARRAARKLARQT